MSKIFDSKYTWVYMILALALVSIALTACAPAMNAPKDQFPFYGKDNRTGLCFAFAKLASNNAIFTNVPCTPEVLQAISEDSKKG